MPARIIQTPWVLLAVVACGGRTDHDASLPLGVAGAAPASTSGAGRSLGGASASVGGSTAAEAPASGMAGTSAIAACATTRCVSRCADLTTDSENCGSCGNACPNGSACQNGVCSPAMVRCNAAPNVGPNASDLLLGDWNNDGNLDVATFAYSGAASVLLGCGDGSFETSIEYSLGSSLGQVASCDLNHDGNLDLVAANSSDESVGVLLGSSDGVFSSSSSYAAPEPYRLACGDLNGDGWADVAVGVRTGTLSVLLNAGDGSLGEPRSLPAESSAGVLVGDLNEDGKADLVAGSSYGDVTSMLGSADGSLGRPLKHEDSLTTNALVLGDLNGDGYLDLGRGDDGGRGGPGSVGIVLGHGDGTFGGRVDYPPSLHVCRVATGDLNADGRLDLVAASNTNLAVLLGDPRSELSRVADQTWINNCVFGLGDVNGDGRADFVKVDVNTNQLVTKLSNGDGSFR